ncbi:MAG: flagellar basal body rod protein FlgC [Planctomycetota bacterium]
MGFDNLLVAGNISASGMSAERLRMEVIANNIANSLSTRGASGGAYRRQDVVFESIVNDQAQNATGPTSGLGGVRVVEVVDDPSEMPRIHDAGHPDADESGFVTMPNVSVPIEMVNLMTASRAYEANLKVLQSLRQQMEQTLSLIRY